MAREISLVCDFIFGSIHRGLPKDMVNVELMIRMVKAIYTYRKDHTAEYMEFAPWSRTIIPFLPYIAKSKLSRMKTGRQWHVVMTMPCPTFLPLPNSTINMPQERPILDGLAEGTISNL